MWIVCGILSVMFTILSWVFTIRNSKKVCWAVFGAISFTALTVLMEYHLVLDWVNNEDWAALMDVVPSMFGFLTVYLVILILVNALALVCKKRNDT